MSSKAVDEGSKRVIAFLKKNVPKSDLANIDSELSKDFIFAKRKSKEQKRKNSKVKTRALTRREKKNLGIHDIPRDSLKYTDMIPLNVLWLDYMSELLQINDTIPDISSKAWEQLTRSIYKADFHGSLLKVVRSKCPSYVNKTGICVMDARNTFTIVSKNNIVTTIPKNDCVFEMELRNIKITLFGKLLATRPAERSTKKIRTQLFPDLWQLKLNQGRMK